MMKLLDRIFNIFDKFFRVACVISLACNIGLVGYVIYQQQYISDAETRISNVRQAKNEMEAELSAAKIDLEKQAEKTDVAEETISRMTDEYNQVEDDKKQLEDRVEYLESLLDESESENDSLQKSTTVYITETGEKYHNLGCRYLNNSSIPVSLDYAKTEGYTPCQYCMP